MSKTIRVSDDLYEAIDDYRKKDQSFQDVIEEMAEEMGLLPARIQDAEDLRNKLENLYGYNSEETSDVIEALRYIYIGQEKENNIGVPHAYADGKYKDEIDALKRLGLVKEEHYTGKYDYGYRATAVGDEIGSELVRELIQEQDDDLENILDSYNDELLAILIRFGFSKTNTGHLSNRSAKLAGSYVTDFWDIPELSEKYRQFTQNLTNLGIAVRYGSDVQRVVLPPEFQDYLQQRNDPKLDSVMRDIEINQVILNYAKDKIEGRDEILAHLNNATEDEFKNRIQEFYQDNLTSRYLPGRDAPFLIKDKEGIEDRVAHEMKQTLGLSEQ